MAWLSFTNRIRIIISNCDIDNDLTNFPVLLNISSAAGKNSVDLSCVFEELETSVNRKKIAVTDSTGTNQCYVEIERWDQSEKSAQLWVKVPDIDNSTDTILYFYYDKDSDDNNSYVGDTGSTAAKNVWDDNFVAVYHLNNLQILDSTSNTASGTCYGDLDNSDVIDANIGKGLSLNGSNQYLKTGSVSFANTVSLEILCQSNTSNWNESGFLFSRRVNNGIILHPKKDTTEVDSFRIDSSGSYFALPIITPTTITTWSYYALSSNCTTSNHKIFSNTSSVSSTQTLTVSTLNNYILIGKDDLDASYTRYLNGQIREARISKIDRSDTWIKTTYYSNFDNLVIYDLTAETQWLYDTVDNKKDYWGNRIEIKTDYSKIGCALIDFPVLVNLSDSSGINNTDLSEFFESIDYDTFTHPNTVTIDNFEGSNGDLPNRQLWRIDDDSASINYIWDNTYRVADTNTQSAGSINSNFILSGDFDIEVEVSTFLRNNTWDNEFVVKCVLLNTNSDVLLTHYLNVSSSDTNNYRFSANEKISGSWKTETNTQSNVSSFKLRIVRNSTTVTYYYDVGSGWVSIRTSTSMPIDDCYISLYGRQGTNNATFNIETNYFKINSVDTLKWPVFVEDFTGEDDSYPNSLYWEHEVRSTTTGTALIKNNKLHVTMQSTTNQWVANFLHFTPLKLHNNFDVEIAFSNLTITDSSSAKGMFQGLSISTTSSDYFLAAGHYNSNNFWYSNPSGQTKPARSNGYGKLRILREGTTIKYYVEDGDSSWNLLNTYTLNTDDISISLYLYLDNSNSSLTGDFDNFIVNQGTIIWPQQTFPNRKKIAITSGDGLTQLPVEIERWDQLNKSIQLWTKLPVVYSDKYTYLYFYYDKDKDDNTDNVGDTGTDPADNVWNDNFVAVYHMSQDPGGSGACILDSTKNSYNGTPHGSITSSNLVDANIGKGLEFNGNDDCVNYGTYNPSSYDLTIESVFKLKTLSSSAGHPLHFLLKRDSWASDGMMWQIHISTDNKFNFVTASHSTSAQQFDYVTNNTNFENMAIVHKDSGKDTLYINNNANSSHTALVFDSKTDSTVAAYGRCDSSGVGVNGILRELRLSNIVRYDCWVKTTYYSNFDNLLYFGDESKFPRYCFFGIVRELDQPVQRTLYLYRRVDGDLMDTTLSSELGHYYLYTPYNEPHNIVCLDNASGTAYMDQIVSNILPNIMVE